MGLFSGLSTKKIAELFEFNLLPPPEKEDAKVGLGKLGSSFIIPIVCFLLTGIAFGLEELAVKPSRIGWQTAVSNIQAELNSPTNNLGQLKIVNGELVVKTDLIEDPVSKNVDFEQIFAVVTDLFGEYRRAEPTSYGREDDGEFIVFGTTENSEDPADLLEDFKAEPRVAQALLKSVNYDQDQDIYQFVIGFFLEQNLENQSDQIPEATPISPDTSSNVKNTQKINSKYYFKFTEKT